MSKLFTYLALLCVSACYNSLTVSVTGGKERPIFHIDISQSVKRSYCIESIEVIDQKSNSFWSVHRKQGRCLETDSVSYATTPDGFYDLGQPTKLDSDIPYYFYLHGSNVDGGTKFVWHKDRWLFDPIVPNGQ